MKFLLERLNPCARRDLQKQPVKGFTVVELLVVVGCVTILAAAAGPSVLNYLRESGLRKAVHQLSGDLYRTKSQAIRTRGVLTVNLNQGANTYLCPNPNRTINLADFWGNPVFTNNPDGGPDAFSNQIRFDTRGLSGFVPPVTTQVYIADQIAGPLGVGDGRIFRVQVSAAGAVSIHEWRGGRWIQ